MILQKKDGLKKIIGLRKDVTNGREWKYLIFYDLDNPSEADIRELRDQFELRRLSYIIYKTKNGVHALGLIPLSFTDWAEFFTELQFYIPEYYSGMIIRISLKEEEKQELLYYNYDYPLMPNLSMIYEKRFPQINQVVRPENTISGWKLVFEKYWSKKV